LKNWLQWLALRHTSRMIEFETTHHVRNEWNGVSPARLALSTKRI
jgi:hypothetical protein